MLYRIKNWADQFENSRTRSMKHMQWIPVPNKHDGDGYTELVDRDNGAEMLGAWLAILQVASKCRERGTLLRDNCQPHDAATISRVSRIKRESIEQALQLLVSDEISWMEVLDDKGLVGACREGDRKVQGCLHPTDEEEKGMEGNGKKGIEEEGTQPSWLLLHPRREMIDEVITCRHEFRNIHPEAVARVINDHQGNPKMEENHTEFIQDMANSLQPPKIPMKLYGRYLEQTGRKSAKKGPDHE